MSLVTGEARNDRAALASRHRHDYAALVVLLGSFLLLYFAIGSTESGDTLRYAGDVVHHARGESAQFWEFGHLLWRPWGYVGFRSIGPLFREWFRDTDVQAVARFFIVTNFVCCLGTLILTWALLLRLVSLPLATLVAIAFCGANCFLDYITLGSAYLPALFFECLGLWLIVVGSRPPRHKVIWFSLAGASYAVSVLLWFPYIFVSAGMVVFLFLWPLDNAGHFDRHNWARQIRPGAIFVVSFVIFYAAVLSNGALADGIHNAAQFKQWIIDSDSGWSQHLNIVRAATGVPRSLYELASDTILLKRWFFHDPYNVVHIGQLAGALFLKMAFFYLGILSIAWILFREKSGRMTLAVMLSAALPLLFFAIVIFEPGSTSRYLPLLPFLYLAAAVALARGSNRQLAYAGVIALLASSLAFNIFTLTHESSVMTSEVRNERTLLDRAISNEAVVFIPTLHEQFYYVPLTRPLDHGLSSSKYQTMDVVEVASTRLLHWRTEFAARVLDAWSTGKEVWLSRHVDANRPDASWEWIEGDDPRIKWAELPSFFQQFQTDASVGSEANGFVRLAKTPVNVSLLSQLRSADPKYIDPGSRSFEN